MRMKNLLLSKAVQSSSQFQLNGTTTFVERAVSWEEGKNNTQQQYTTTTTTFQQREQVENKKMMINNKSTTRRRRRLPRWFFPSSSSEFFLDVAYLSLIVNVNLLSHSDHHLQLLPSFRAANRQFPHCSLCLFLESPISQNGALSWTTLTANPLRFMMLSTQWGLHQDKHDDVHNAMKRE